MSHPSIISFPKNALTALELHGVESYLPWQLASGAFLMFHRLLLFNTCILFSLYLCLCEPVCHWRTMGKGKTTMVMVKLWSTCTMQLFKLWHTLWGHPSSLLLGYAIMNPALAYSAPVFKYNLLKEQAGSIVICRKPTRPGRSRELSEIDSTKEVHRRQNWGYSCLGMVGWNQERPKSSWSWS